MVVCAALWAGKAHEANGMPNWLKTLVQITIDFSCRRNRENLLLEIACLPWLQM